jgi:hypothetical protein
MKKIYLSDSELSKQLESLEQENRRLNFTNK